MASTTVPFGGRAHGGRADAARNREHLLGVVRQMIARDGVAAVTMDGLAEQAGLGKGTVYRRFGSRAGIFRALLDVDEHEFQERMMFGPPPLGPGAEPLLRLLAYGPARIKHLLAHREILAAAIDNRSDRPVAADAAMSRLHIETLLRESVDDTDLRWALATQLHSALEAPIVLYLSAAEHPDIDGVNARLSRGWRALVVALVGDRQRTAR